MPSAALSAAPAPEALASSRRVRAPLLGTGDSSMISSNGTLATAHRGKAVDKIRITKRTVEAIEPDPARDVLIWDADIPGFGVKVTPRRVRVYVLQYSHRNRSRRITIGRHG